jgi:hypothetical protein
VAAQHAEQVAGKLMRADAGLGVNRHQITLAQDRRPSLKSQFAASVRT